MRVPFSVVISGGAAFDSETGEPATLADGNRPPRQRRRRRRPITAPAASSQPGLFETESERTAEAGS